MGSELLTKETTTQGKTSTEIFEECFPFYLAIGMSYAEYWAGDPILAQYYRKAYRIKQEEFNNNAWLQGMYVYEALIDVTPYLKAFSKGKPKPYAKEPYDIFEDEAKKRQEREEKERYEHMKEKIAIFAAEFNKKRKETEMKGVEGSA